MGRRWSIAEATVLVPMSEDELRPAHYAMETYYTLEEGRRVTGPLISTSALGGS